MALLEGSVRTETTVTNGMVDLGSSAASIERLTEGLMSGILYACDVDGHQTGSNPTGSNLG